MATIVYRNAKLFLNDAQLDPQLTELSVDFKAEILDATTMGADTRIKKGGLFMSTINGKGFFDPVNGVLGLENVIFSNIGVDDVVATIYADGITEGSPLLAGFSCKGVLSTFMLGGAVGALLPVTFAVESRGTV